MSKELEALDFLGKIYTKRNLQDFPIGNQPKQIVKMKVKNMPEFETIKKALTPPTADEVCMALSEYLRTVYGKVYIYYEDENFGMEIQHSADETATHELVGLLNDNILYISENLPPHLIAMIGKFYESLKEDLNV